MNAAMVTMIFPYWAIIKKTILCNNTDPIAKMRVAHIFGHGQKNVFGVQLKLIKIKMLLRVKWIIAITIVLK